MPRKWGNICEKNLEEDDAAADAAFGYKIYVQIKSKCNDSKNILLSEKRKQRKVLIFYNLIKSSSSYGTFENFEALKIVC